MPMRLELPGVTPPSLNRVGSRGAQQAWHRHKKWWQEQIGMALLVEVRPRRELTTPVLVDAVLWFRTRCNRDEGNFRSLLEKSTGDALVEGGWIPDDSAVYFQFRHITFLKGNTATTLLLREGWNDGASARLAPPSVVSRNVRLGRGARGSVPRTSPPK